MQKYRIIFKIVKIVLIGLLSKKTVWIAKDHKVTTNDRGIPLSGRIYVVPIVRKMAGARPWIFLRVIVAQWPLVEK